MVTLNGLYSKPEKPFRKGGKIRQNYLWNCYKGFLADGDLNHSGGSGSAYIYGFCDENWKPDMSEEQCKSFVVQAVSHAMARDGSSGGNIRTVVINKDGVKRSFLDGTQVHSYLT